MINKLEISRELVALSLFRISSLGLKNTNHFTFASKSRHTSALFFFAGLLLHFFSSFLSLHHSLRHPWPTATAATASLLIRPLFRMASEPTSKHFRRACKYRHSDPTPIPEKKPSRRGLIPMRRRCCHVRKRKFYTATD